MESLLHQVFALAPGNVCSFLPCRNHSSNARICAGSGLAKISDTKSRPPLLSAPHRQQHLNHSTNDYNFRDRSHPDTQARALVMGDTYRPKRSLRDQPPSLADRITFSSGGGDSYRPGDRQQNGGRTADHAGFSFSTGYQAPQVPPTGPANGERGARRQRGRGGLYNGRESTRHADSSLPYHTGYRGSSNGYRRGGFKKAPHERALLQVRDDTVEHVMGVSNGSNKFRNVDDMSDDEELVMDVGSSESDDAATAVDGKHKFARKQSSAAADGDSVPKWSNPDPYTVLPPLEETTGKRVDFVKLIRKAKNEAAEKGDAGNAVAANDDFISFGDDNDATAHQPGVLDDEAPPLAPWHHSSGHRQPLAGSLNEVSTSGPLSAANGSARRTAVSASLPARPQHRGKAPKRKRSDGIDIVEEWQPTANKHSTPWAKEPKHNHLKDPTQW
jgi:non-canonical poly(A) RNA polymerase PAPD5/7